MISVRPEECERIHQIYQRTLAPKGSNSNEVNWDYKDILTLSQMMSTHYVRMPLLKGNPVYWSLLNAWVDYMRTGVWLSAPRMWYDVLCGANNAPMLNPYQIEEEYMMYLRNREAMCRSLGLLAQPHMDGAVKLHWLTKCVDNKDSSFFALPHTLLRAYVNKSSISVKGLLSNDSTPVDSYVDSKGKMTSFNDANQAIWPIEGDTKLEQVKYGLSHPPERK